MSVRSRAHPWFRRTLTADQLRLAASFQFGFDLPEEPLDSMLAEAKKRYDDWFWKADDSIAYTYVNPAPYRDPMRYDDILATIARAQLINKICALADAAVHKPLEDYEFGPKFDVSSSTVFDEASQSYRITWTLTPSRGTR